MRKSIICATAVLSAFLLTGAACKTTQPPTIVYKTVVITPPKTLFNCPQIGKLPNWETLTNQELAELVEKLYRFNRICGINMAEIQKYVEAAEKMIAERDATAE